MKAGISATNFQNSALGGSRQVDFIPEIAENMKAREKPV